MVAGISCWFASPLGGGGVLSRTWSRDSESTTTSFEWSERVGITASFWIGWVYTSWLAQRSYICFSIRMASAGSFNSDAGCILFAGSKSSGSPWKAPGCYRSYFWEYDLARESSRIASSKNGSTIESGNYEIVWCIWKAGLSSPYSTTSTSGIGGLWGSLITRRSRYSLTQADRSALRFRSAQ